MAKTHGKCETSEYRSWESMKQRCFNSNHKNYLHYGGRGITICDRWLNSFENFFADMGLKPSSAYSIDRINNDGDYCPDNCKWSTKKEQQNNQRSNHLITIACVTLTIAQWTIEMGFGENVILGRLRLGWSESDAVLTPVYTARLITDGFKILTIVQWKNEMGFNKNVIVNRLNLGWSERDAILTPVRVKKTK